MSILFKNRKGCLFAFILAAFVIGTRDQGFNEWSARRNWQGSTSLDRGREAVVGGKDGTSNSVIKAFNNQVRKSLPKGLMDASYELVVLGWLDNFLACGSRMA